MSRKNIQISLPAVPFEASAHNETGARSGAEEGIDSWVARAQDTPRMFAEDAFSPAGAGEGVTIKVRLSPEPDWAEAAKIFWFLPQAALWFWTFGLARKAMRFSPIARR